MYYRAREKAVNNNYDWHVAAILRRNKSVIKIGVNSTKTHPAYQRTYGNFHCAYLHAEMSVISRAKPGDIIEVFRISKNGNTCMAKPCEHCMAAIIKAGIRTIKYTDHNGQWQTIKL